MDIRHRLRLFRSWARWIIAATVIAAVAAYGVSQILPKVYEADARLVVGQALSSNNPDPNSFQTAQQLAAAYVGLAFDRPVLERVMKRVGVTMPLTDFSKMLSVEAVRDLPFIEVTGRSGNPKLASDIANAMALELVALSPTLNGAQSDRVDFVDADMKALETQIASTREQIDQLGAKTNKTDAEQAQLDALIARLVTQQSTYAQLLQFTQQAQGNRISVVQDAIQPDSPASPRPLFNTAIAAALALLLTVAAAFLWERFDDRIKSPEDLEEATGLAVIGLIAQMPGDRARKPFYRLATLLYPRSPAAEAFRTVRTNVEFAGLDRGLRTIVVTSSLPGEGKTVVAGNLAVAFAQAGRRVLLVDADLRRPGVAPLFGLSEDQGLTDLVRSDSIQIDTVAQETEVPNLRVVTSGTIPANPAELLGSRRMELISSRLRDAADILIIDTPPVTAVTHAALTAAKADETVMVLQSHRASKRVVSQGLEALTKVNARIVGAVLNNVPGHVAVPYYGRGQADQHNAPHPRIDLPAAPAAGGGRADTVATAATGGSAGPGAPDQSAAAAADPGQGTRQGPARRSRSRTRSTTIDEPNPS